MPADILHRVKIRPGLSLYLFFTKHKANMHEDMYCLGETSTPLKELFLAHLFLFGNEPELIRFNIFGSTFIKTNLNYPNLLFTWKSRYITRHTCIGSNRLEILGTYLCFVSRLKAYVAARIFMPKSTPRISVFWIDILRHLEKWITMIFTDIHDYRGYLRNVCAYFLLPQKHWRSFSTPESAEYATQSTQTVLGLPT